MSTDRSELLALAEVHGWTRAERYGYCDRFSRADDGNVYIWFNANNPDEVSCADADAWKRESYGSAGFNRACRELRRKMGEGMSDDA